MNFRFSVSTFLQLLVAAQLSHFSKVIFWVSKLEDEMEETQKSQTAINKRLLHQSEANEHNKANSRTRFKSSRD